MLTERESRPEDEWQGWLCDYKPRTEAEIKQHRLDQDNPVCEGCGRSLMSRFGGDVTTECPSCEDDFKREYDACGGMIEIG